MKIITIGDLHGSPDWKSIDPGAWDTMVFVGDYVDSSTYTDNETIDNLKEVIALKKALPDKVVLLWGNHDLAYFFGGHSRHYCTGFRHLLLPVFYNLFTSNRECFQAAFQHENYLWTHAGVNKSWFESNVRKEILTKDMNLAGTLNRLFDQHYEPLFDISLYRGGHNTHGGIFWSHNSETLSDPLSGYHQVIGHTRTTGIQKHSFDSVENTSVTCVDCLHTESTFHELEL